MQATTEHLRFYETNFGFNAVSRNGDHVYVITSNSIDYDLVHYWAHATQGELLDKLDLHAAMQAARQHFATLQ